MRRGTVYKTAAFVAELSGIIPRMKTKNWLPQLVILAGLLALIGGGYALARLLPEALTAPGLPPLSRLHLPPQTQNGITASLDSYYADAMRLVFTVHLTGAEVFPSEVSLTSADGAWANSSAGVNMGGDPSHYLFDLASEMPLRSDRFQGQLEFIVTASPGDDNPVATFRFDLDLPIHPALTFEPKQTVWADGLEILLDRLVITPAQTYAYLCYLTPTRADWTIGGDATVRVGSQVAGIQSYALLFDSVYGDGSKGGDPGWTSPIQNGRCVIIGFPIGAENPESITLTIPNLEQSMPEVIPAENLAAAYPRLLDQGIDMEWHTVDHGAYPEWKKLPAGMSEQEAYRQFIRALGYLHPGPWKFELQLKPGEGSQPRFTTSSYGAATPIPLSTVEPRLAAALPGRIHSFDMSPDQKTIAFATSQGVVLYNLETFKLLRTLEESENIFQVAFSPDGTKLAAGSILMHTSESGLPHVIVWDAATWKTLFERENQEEASIPFGALAWSPDGNLLAFSLPDRGLVAVDIKTGEAVSLQKNFIVPPYDIDWSPDGSRLIATGDLAYGFRRWRVDTGESVRLYDSRAGAAPIQLAWSPDGTRIASAHADGTVCLWTTATNQCDGLIYAHHYQGTALAWSPDGSQLATGGGVIRIWDTSTGQQFTAFGQREGMLYTQLEWLDSNTLASLEMDYANDSPTIVRFWDVATGKILMEFQGGKGELWQ